MDKRNRRGKPTTPSNLIVVTALIELFGIYFAATGEGTDVLIGLAFATFGIIGTGYLVQRYWGL